MFAGVRDARHATVFCLLTHKHTHKTKQIFATMSRQERILIIEEMAAFYWEDVYQGTVMTSNACTS
jgi:hypothetical protein